MNLAKHQLLIGVAILHALSIVACKRQSGGFEEESSSQKSCGSTRSTQKSSTPDVVTFRGDLLPILASNTRGNVYKCTTCHAEYLDANRLINVAELTRVIDSMKTLRMPRGGDPVPAAQIQLFSEWRLQGFKVGESNQGPSRSGISAGVDKLSGDCSP